MSVFLFSFFSHLPTPRTTHLSIMCILYAYCNDELHTPLNIISIQLIPLCNAWSWVSQANNQLKMHCFILFIFFAMPFPLSLFFDVDHGLGPIPFGFSSTLRLRIYTPPKIIPRTFFFSFSSSPLLSFVFLFFSWLLHRHHLSSLFSSLFSFFINNKHPLSSVDPLSLSSLLSFFLSVFLSFLKKKILLQQHTHSLPLNIPPRTTTKHLSTAQHSIASPSLSNSHSLYSHSFTNTSYTPSFPPLHIPFQLQLQHWYSTLPSSPHTHTYIHTHARPSPFQPSPLSLPI